MLTDVLVIAGILAAGILIGTKWAHIFVGIPFIGRWL